MKKRGMTLVEVMVVMLIIAVLMLLSGKALRGVYNSYMADQIAEQVLTTIREAQNKSISVYNGKKVWAARIYVKKDTDTSSKLELLSYDLSGANLAVSTPIPETTTLKATTISLTRAYSAAGSCQMTYSTDSTVSFTFAFSAPFGKPYYFVGTSGQRDCADASAGSNFCAWQKNANFLQDWAVKITSASCSDQYIVRPAQSQTSSDQANIDITFNGSSRRVIIKGNGEAYIE
jgi:prepilin-type N-terminal cleavage/methylation domain-containing protein